MKKKGGEKKGKEREEGREKGRERRGKEGRRGRGRKEEEGKGVEWNGMESTKILKINLASMTLSVFEAQPFASCKPFHVAYDVWYIFAPVDKI